MDPDRREGVSFASLLRASLLVCGIGLAVALAVWFLFRRLRL